MQEPNIGQAVTYRSPESKLDCPAIITATASTLPEEGINDVPPLGAGEVHLTVLAPGMPADPKFNVQFAPDKDEVGAAEWESELPGRIRWPDET